MGTLVRRNPKHHATLWLHGGPNNATSTTTKPSAHVSVAPPPPFVDVYANPRRPVLMCRSRRHSWWSQSFLHLTIALVLFVVQVDGECTARTKNAAARDSSMDSAQAGPGIHLGIDKLVAALRVARILAESSFDHPFLTTKFYSSSIDFGINIGCFIRFTILRLSYLVRDGL